MKKINTLLVADAILNLLGTLHIENGDEMYVENFVNGREQGYSICYTIEKDTIKISFSENRNSDEVVVYTYVNGEQKSVSYFDSVDASAKFIQKLLNN